MEDSISQSLATHCMVIIGLWKLPYSVSPANDWLMESSIQCVPHDWLMQASIQCAPHDWLMEAPIQGVPHDWLMEASIQCVS